MKGVRSFLGFRNFYQRFICNYAKIAQPLNKLTKKTKAFEWSPECQNAFNRLKKKFLEKPVLIMPDPTKSFYRHINGLPVLYYNKEIVMEI